MSDTDTIGWVLIFVGGWLVFALDMVLTEWLGLFENSYWSMRALFYAAMPVFSVGCLLQREVVLKVVGGLFLTIWIYLVIMNLMLVSMGRY